jgi:hypothetical protein
VIDATALPARDRLLLPVILWHHLLRPPRSHDEREGLGDLIEHVDRSLKRYVEELSIRPVPLLCKELVDVLLRKVMIGDMYVVQELKAVRQTGSPAKFFSSLRRVARRLSDLEQVLTEGRIAKDVEPADILIGLLPHVHANPDGRCPNCLI